MQKLMLLFVCCKKDSLFFIYLLFFHYFSLFFIYLFIYSLFVIFFIFRIYSLPNIVKWKAELILNVVNAEVNAIICMFIKYIFLFFVYSILFIIYLLFIYYLFIIYLLFFEFIRTTLLNGIQN